MRLNSYVCAGVNLGTLARWKSDF